MLFWTEQMDKLPLLQLSYETRFVYKQAPSIETKTETTASSTTTKNRIILRAEEQKQYITPLPSLPSPPPLQHLPTYAIDR